MRNLFLALVLANLAFAAWHAWFAVPGQPPSAPRGDVPSLQLASEVANLAAAVDAAASDAAAVPGGAGGAAAAVTQAVVTGAAAAQPPAAPAAAGQTCVSVGPFRELSQAAAASAKLRGSGLDPVQRAGEGDVWVGYWVYVAAIPTVEEAEQVLARLRASGITDSYVIPNSDSGNLVSLGVFTEVARAASRLGAVRELGLEATVADRTRRATVYWVDVLLEADQTLDFELLQPPGRINRLEQRLCNPSIA